MNKPVTKQLTQLAKKSTRFTLITMGILASILFFNDETPAQPAPKPNIFENITIKPKFSPDPQIIKGISGGSVPASHVAGRKDTATGPCAGFVDSKPDHTLNITSFFNYLSLVVESPDDTTLVIVGPGGTWCNDDYTGKNKNPGISGQWLPGTYNIWVGSYDQTKFHPYIIKLSEVRN